MRARDNPFRTEQVLQVRYRLEGASWPELLERCEALRCRGALVGPHGSGKTTLLEELERRFQQQGRRTRFIRLDNDHRRFERGHVQQLAAELTPADILFFDGAEQLSALEWYWFKWRFREIGGLIITLHQRGRLPTLWECRTSPGLLADIAGPLLGQDRAAVVKEAGIIYQKCQGNLREALRTWYDQFAAQNDLAR